MSAGDFYVKSRQFFGFLVPGTLWTLVAMILLRLGPLHPTTLIFGASPTWVEASAFFVASFLLGRSFSPASFWVAEQFAGLLARRETIRRKQARVKEMEGRVLDILRAQFFADAWATEVARRAEDMRSRALDQDKIDLLFVWCKREVIRQSELFRSQLEEVESELNLFGALPLPATALAFAWPIASGLSSSPTQPDVATVAWRLSFLVPVLCLLVACVLLVRWRGRKLQEAVECYEAFCHLFGSPPPSLSVAAKDVREC